MRRPLPPVTLLALGTAGGIALGLRFPGAIAALAVGAGVVALALGIGGGRLRQSALVAGAVVGWVLGAGAAARVAGDLRERLPDGARLEVRGTFEARAWPGATAQLRVDSLRIAGRWLTGAGEVRALQPRGATPAAAGAAVVGWGTWWATPRDGPWPRRPERAGTLVLDSLQVIPATHRHPLLSARDAAQRLLRAMLGNRAGMAESLILAQRGGLDDDLTQRFAAAGLSHLLAISGLHVGLVAAAVLLLARLLRLPLGYGRFLTAGAVFGYVGFLGAPAPATRAALQMALLLLGRRLQRPADPLAPLAACALLLMVADPLDVLDAGFELSFVGVAGIVMLRAPLASRLRIVRPRALAAALAVGAAAFLATAAVAALRFGQLAPIGLLANLAAVPLAGLAVPATALTLAVGAVAPATGVFLGAGAGALLAALDAVAHWAAAVPGGHAWVSADSVAMALAAIVVALLASRVLARRWAAVRLRHPRLRRLVAAGVGAAVVVAWPAWSLGPGDAVRIFAIDVGQGDALAIRSPGGRWVVVDTGPKSDDFDAGRQRVVPFLLARGVHRVEALILTHPDADHIGGAQAVLDAFPVGMVLEPAVPAGKPLYLAALRDARRHDTPWVAVRDGRELALDGMTLHFLAPDASVLDAREGANEYSVVFALRYGRFGALFMGDAPVAVEERILRAHGRDVQVSLLKVGHHGSRTSTSDALLDAARPRFALISVGRHNRFGHPAPVTLARLALHHVRVFRTDLQGTLSVRGAADGEVEVRTAR